MRIFHLFDVHYVYSGSEILFIFVFFFSFLFFFFCCPFCFPFFISTDIMFPFQAIISKVVEDSYDDHASILEYCHVILRESEHVKAVSDILPACRIECSHRLLSTEVQNDSHRMAIPYLYKHAA